MLYHLLVCLLPEDCDFLLTLDNNSNTISFCHCLYYRVQHSHFDLDTATVLTHTNLALPSGHSPFNSSSHPVGTPFLRYHGRSTEESKHLRTQDDPGRPSHFVIHTVTHRYDDRCHSSSIDPWHTELSRHARIPVPGIFAIHPSIWYPRKHGEGANLVFGRSGSSIPCGLKYSHSPHKPPFLKPFCHNTSTHRRHTFNTLNILPLDAQTLSCVQETIPRHSHPHQLPAYHFTSTRSFSPTAAQP